MINLHKLEALNDQESCQNDEWRKKLFPTNPLILNLVFECLSVKMEFEYQRERT